MLTSAHVHFICETPMSCRLLQSNAAEQFPWANLIKAKLACREKFTHDCRLSAKMVSHKVGSWKEFIEMFGQVWPCVSSNNNKKLNIVDGKTFAPMNFRLSCELNKHFLCRFYRTIYMIWLMLIFIWTWPTNWIKKII